MTIAPIRAVIAKTLEESDYTSIQARIEDLKGQTTPLPLVPFEDQPEPTENPLPYNLCHYLELVDWTGRVVLKDKRGSIPEELEPILDRLGFDENAWLEGIKLFGKPMYQAIGPANQIRQMAQVNHQRWYRGITACQAVFGPP